MLDLGQFHFAADETRQLLRKVMGENAERTQKREILPQSGLVILEDLLRPHEISKTMLAKIGKASLLWQARINRILSGSGENDLATVRGRKHSRNSIQCLPEKCSLTRFGGAARH